MADGDTRSVILVEDDLHTRRLLAHRLSGAGFIVHDFPDGRAAMQGIVDHGLGGLIVADWNMPEMDGLQLCRAIRELEEMQALNSNYIVLLTAFDKKENIIEGLTSGADDYVTKPCHIGELVARLKVGERVLNLQTQLRRHTIEFQKANLELTILSRRLDEMANTDALTGLSNRRCLLSRLDEAWTTTERNSQPLSCIMLDVDRFKRINDTFGHEAGDEILKVTSARLRGAAHRADLCGRLGGEEFAVICPAVTADAAAHIAERVRAAISSAPVPYKDKVIPMTVSCGVSQRRPGISDPGTLLRLADDMLYSAKENGRNQTWVLAADGGGGPVGSTPMPRPTSHFSPTSSDTPARFA